jgi:hypothetical protein
MVVGPAITVAMMGLAAPPVGIFLAADVANEITKQYRKPKAD